MIQVTVETLALTLNARIQNALGHIADRGTKAVYSIGQLHDGAGVRDIQIIANLMNTEIDTAITHAQRQVIRVGDMVATKAPVEAPPSVLLRQVAVGALLDEIVEGMA